MICCKKELESYSSIELAHVIESRGMSLGTFPGLVTLSMLATDLRDGLELIKEIICSPRLPKESFEHVKNRLLADVEDFWDDPQQFIGQLVRENIYDHHPYHKNIFGTRETISLITHEDVKRWFNRMITPLGSRIIVVGDLTNYNVVQEIEKVFSSWSGSALTPMEFPQAAINYGP